LQGCRNPGGPGTDNGYVRIDPDHELFGSFSAKTLAAFLVTPWRVNVFSAN
jgi:hypothetical protein